MDNTGPKIKKTDKSVSVSRYSDDYVQELIRQLEQGQRQRDKQMEVVMKSIKGGMKISRDDDEYSFLYVSEEAAALFGYTVEEFMQVTGGKAKRATYPPDIEEAARVCMECFRDGNPDYAMKYRVRCKDGSLKWVLDSGKKTVDENGVCTINSLYLDITESENKERKLRSQKELLDSIYDTVPCGILRFMKRQNNYRFISANRTVLKIFGYDSMEECMQNWNKGVLGKVDINDQKKIREAYETLKHPGDHITHDYRVYHIDGNIRWIEAVTSVVGVEDDALTFQRTVNDVTERKRLQELLRREQEMYRLAMESSSDELYEYDFKDDVLQLYTPMESKNEKGSVSKEWYPGFIRGGQLERHIHQEDLPDIMKNFNSMDEILCDIRIWEKEAGEFQWHRVTGKTIFSNGKRERLVGTLKNIHKEKQELSRNERTLRMNQMALEAIRDTFIHIFCVNLTEDSYDSLRMQEEEGLEELPQRGRYSSVLVDYIMGQIQEDDRERLLNFLSVEVLKQRFSGVEDHIEIEVRQQRTTSEAGWVRIEGSLISSEGKSTENIVLTFLNIDEEKQRELEYMEEELKARKALEEAYEIAQKASEAKSDFLSQMSHDIRTPINAIMGMTTIAQSQINNGDRVEKCLGQVQRSSRHLLNLLNKVLDMAKIENNSTALNINAFSVQNLIESLEEMVRSDMEKKGHHFKIKVQKLIHEWVEGDFLQIQRIFLNLLTNAIKYTQTNGDIYFGVEEKLNLESGVGCYEFLVEDNGIGMTQEFLSRVFEPFERAQDMRVQQFHGTGLGMAITANLIRMMGGNIEIESEPEQGTRVKVTLYLNCASKKRVEVEEQVPVTFNGERILLVEDNEVNREIAKELLGMIGLKCTEAQDGQQALEMFENSEPGCYKIILMDIQMPVMDGYQAARAIRSLNREDAQKIPIIALTANAFADDVYHAAGAGMNEHISKPFELGKMSRVIYRWISADELQ